MLCYVVVILPLSVCRKEQWAKSNNAGMSSLSWLRVAIETGRANHSDFLGKGKPALTNSANRASWDTVVLRYCCYAPKNSVPFVFYYEALKRSFELGPCEAGALIAVVNDYVFVDKIYSGSTMGSPTRAVLSLEYGQKTRSSWPLTLTEEEWPF